MIRQHNVAELERNGSLVCGEQVLAEPAKIRPAVRLVIWFAMLSAWLIQALAARHNLDADGVSYLDIAHSCLRGDWHALINGYWSPGYPLLLVAWLKLLHPSLFREILAVRMLGVITLLFALISFEFSLRTFLRFRRTITANNEGAISDHAVCAIGYALFFWTTVFMVPASLDQPDILVFTLYLLAVSVGMELTSGHLQWPRFMAFGLILGLAYAAKAVMFPLAFLSLASLIFYKDVRKLWPRLLLALAVFAVTCAPFVLLLSQSKKRLTFGDAGLVNYWHVIDETDEYAGSVNHPLPRIQAAPHLANYASIIHLGTYPPWADPSYGYSGVHHHFNLRRQLNRTHIVLRAYFGIFVIQLGGLLCGFLVLIYWTNDLKGFVRRCARLVALWAPAIAGLCLYALVRVEDRFLPGFVIALFFVTVQALRLDSAYAGLKNVRAVVFAVTVLLLATIVVQVGHLGLQVPHNSFPDWDVVVALRQMGINEGERVSYMGYALTDHSWAHLARTPIAAEIPVEDRETFWAADQSEKLKALQELAASGAQVLITRDVPSVATLMDWKKIGENNYYVLDLRKSVGLSPTPH